MRIIDFYRIVLFVSFFDFLFPWKHGNIFRENPGTEERVERTDELYKSRLGYLELHLGVANIQNPQEHRMITHGHVWWSRAMWSWNHVAAGRVALLWISLTPLGSSICPPSASGIGPLECNHMGKGRMGTSPHTYPCLAAVAITPTVLDEVEFFAVLWLIGRWVLVIFLRLIRKYKKGNVHYFNYPRKIYNKILLSSISASIFT